MDLNQSRFTGLNTAWCPGCGNFPILDTLVKVLNESELSPNEVLLVGGIGQAAKLNQYVNANGFSGLHGRSLPAAVATKIVNEKLTVIINTGDGDSYGEGGNHFLHNIRRNVDITHLVHNNQIYGLTQGQVSPTSDPCLTENSENACNMGVPFNPLTIAIAAGATFVARSFSGNKEHLATMIKAAINHKGYSLVDIFQPCVSFNKINTYAYYSKRVYELDQTYDSTNKILALEKSMEHGNQIPIGILYQEETLSYQEKHPTLFDGVPLIDKKLDMEKVQELIHTFL